MSSKIIKIITWVLAVISGWLLIGTILAYVLPLVWPKALDGLSFFGFVFIIFLIPANIVGNGFIDAFFPHGNGLIIWALLIIIIFSGSLYLVKKR